jgi:PKD repeat protein
VRYFFLILALFYSAFAYSQLTATGMNTVRYTSVKDPVFIYCSPATTTPGVLNAVCPKGTPPYNFTWYKWSDVTKNFTDLVKTDPGKVSSSAASLDEGGYKVVISGGFDTTMVGWIAIDKPLALAELKNRTCDYVALKGKAAIDTFFYRNLTTGAPVRLPNAVKFLWSSDPVSSIPFPDLAINPQTFNPPLVDVTYKIQVSDSFGCLSESSFPYQSIHVKADFSADPIKGEAPLEVNFTDKSIRGLNYTWEYNDHSTDSISYLPNPAPHIFYKPGEYSVKLTIVSDKSCLDSIRLSQKIVVEKSKLDIPNVFSPDGDGLNDYFKVSAVSLRYLNVEIFSRSGMKVYAFYGEGETLRKWMGWDGNVNSTSAKASPGVYYYIISAYGWDDINYNTKQYRGFVYLYR